MPGTLHVVATPIGNLEDISLRALRILKSVSVIAAEDTRRTQILLRHYDISTPAVSHHEHNERTRVPQLIARLVGGDDVALVTDAGTPTVSDPGLTLVRAAREAGLKVEIVPGPSAVLAALVLSGLPTGEFTFVGFAPARTKDKAAWVRTVAAEPRTVVFFDSPRRVRDTLTRFSVMNPNREVVVARELTKKFESVVKCPISKAAASLPQALRGEITVVLEACDSVIQPIIADDTCDGGAGAATDTGVMTEYQRLIQQPGQSRRAVIKTLATQLNTTTRAVYSSIERAKKAGSA
jgi:16S rRNA (cytidine1402-2'-O)-methyltransferase